MYKKMKATVKGVTCSGNRFVENLEFEMIPPKAGELHYGTGYYMTVNMSLSGRQLIDVRYDRTTDIEILADRFIESWYGENAHEIIKQFSKEDAS